MSRRLRGRPALVQLARAAAAFARGELAMAAHPTRHTIEFGKLARTETAVHTAEEAAEGTRALINQLAELHRSTAAGTSLLSAALALPANFALPDEAVAAEDRARDWEARYRDSETAVTTHRREKDRLLDALRALQGATWRADTVAVDQYLALVHAGGPIASTFRTVEDARRARLNASAEQRLPTGVFEPMAAQNHPLAGILSDSDEERFVRGIREAQERSAARLAAAREMMRTRIDALDAARSVTHALVLDSETPSRVFEVGYGAARVGDHVDVGDEEQNQHRVFIAESEDQWDGEITALTAGWATVRMTPVGESRWQYQHARDAREVPGERQLPIFGGELLTVGDSVMFGTEGPDPEPDCIRRVRRTGGRWDGTVTALDQPGWATVRMTTTGEAEFTRRARHHDLAVVAPEWGQGWSGGWTSSRELMTHRTTPPTPENAPRLFTTFQSVHRLNVGQRVMRSALDRNIVVACDQDLAAQAVGIVHQVREQADDRGPGQVVVQLYTTAVAVPHGR